MRSPVLATYDNNAENIVATKTTKDNTSWTLAPLMQQHDQPAAPRSGGRIRLPVQVQPGLLRHPRGCRRQRRDPLVLRVSFRRRRVGHSRGDQRSGLLLSRGLVSRRGRRGVRAVHGRNIQGASSTQRQTADGVVGLSSRKPRRAGIKSKRSPQRRDENSKEAPTSLRSDTKDWLPVRVTNPTAPRIHVTNTQLLL